MCIEVDEYGRPVVCAGKACRIVLAVTLAGKCPVGRFMDELAKRRPKLLRQLLALMQRAAAEGVPLRNKTQFRKEKDGIFAFKRGQARIACYQDGDFWVLVHGFVKKCDRWPKQELEKAERVMHEDYQRRLSQ